MQIPPTDLDVPILGQLALWQLPLGDALEPRPLKVVRLDSALGGRPLRQEVLEQAARHPDNAVVFPDLYGLPLGRSSGRLRGRRRTSGPPIEPCGAIVFSKRSDYGAQQVPLGPARARAYVPPYVWPCAPLFTGKQPYPIALADRGMMALAGLWENWRSPAGEWIRSFAVVTCPPNELCAELHNRMPVVLGPETWQAWLGEEPADARQLKAILVPYPSEKMTCWPVSTRVGNVKNNDSSLIEPVAA